MLMSSGRRLHAGQRVYRSQVSDQTWESWVKEGVLIFPEIPPPITKTARARLKRGKDKVV